MFQLVIVLAASASAKPWIYYNSGYPYSNHITSILNSYTAPVSYISSVSDKIDYTKINLRSQKCKNVAGHPVPCAHPAGGIVGNNFYAYNDAPLINAIAPIPKKSSTPNSTSASTPTLTPTPSPTPTPTPKISTSSSTTTDEMDYYYYEYEIHQTAATPKTISNATSTPTTPKPPSVNPTTEPEYYYYEYDVDQAPIMDPNIVIKNRTELNL